MTIYQKAIKVRKVCESQRVCKNCQYYNKCKKCIYHRFTLLNVTIKDLSEVIKKEKWKVK